jgi:CheY-like chemotaxis protein
VAKITHSSHVRNSARKSAYRHRPAKIDFQAQISGECADIQDVTSDLTAQAAVQRSVPPPTLQCPQTKVLVVDDDVDFRVLARRILQTAGFEVSEAATVYECLDHLRYYPTDLVILDIVLPDRDGIEALAEIKALFPETRVLTVSGAANWELYLRVSSYLGADASLDKSRIVSLCSLLRVVLDR